MHDWNVVITVHGKKFNEALRFFKTFGPVSRTDFYNVLVCRTEDIPAMMETVRARMEEHPDSETRVARLIPLQHTFRFQAPDEFEGRAREIVRDLADGLSNRAFYVRMHRRGFKGRLSSIEIEQSLSNTILEVLEKKGAPGVIRFEGPEAVVVVETIGQHAGISLFTRSQLERYPFLKIG